MSRIDTKKPRIPAWIVWSLATSGNYILNAICLENSRALSYKKALENDHRFGSKFVRVWIEKTEINHMFFYETGWTSTPPPTH